MDWGLCAKDGHAEVVVEKMIFFWEKIFAWTKIELDSWSNNPVLLRCMVHFFCANVPFLIVPYHSSTILHKTIVWQPVWFSRSLYLDSSWVLREGETLTWCGDIITVTSSLPLLHPERFSLVRSPLMFPTTGRQLFFSFFEKYVKTRRNFLAKIFAKVK